MNISKALQADLIEILYLVKVCVQEKNDPCLCYWDLQHQLIKKDIEEGLVYIYRENEVCLGAITLNPLPLEETKDSKWQDTSAKPLFIHRLLVHPNWKDRHIADSLVAFAEKYALDNGFTSLRLEAFSEDIQSMDFITEHSYRNIEDVSCHPRQNPYFYYVKGF